MMHILREHYESELANVEREILDVQAKLTPFSELYICKSSLQNLQTSIEILNRDIVKGKGKKFQRDSLAFNLGRAYKWEKISKTMNKSKISPNTLKQHLPDKTTNTLVSNTSKQTTLLPLPSASSLQIDGQDLSQCSTYTMDEANLDLPSSKRKKLSPTISFGVGDGNATVFSFSKAPMVTPSRFTILFSTVRYRTTST